MKGCLFTLNLHEDAAPCADAELQGGEADVRLDPQGDPVEIGVERDGNADMCCLCNQGGSLLCCDRCPASYHMRCLGEQAKSLPEGEWACPECAVGGRGESAISRAT